MAKWVLIGKFTAVNVYIKRENTGKHFNELKILLKYHKEGEIGHKKGGVIIKKNTNPKYKNSFLKYITVLCKTPQRKTDQKIWTLYIYMLNIQKPINLF